MPTTATATFEVTAWTPTPYDQPDDGPELTRVALSKVFHGDLEGESVGEGLFCGMKAPDAGAGYVVSERVTGRLQGRSGTFVLQHGGVMGAGRAPQTFGHVVPGSGTDQLAGLTGEVEIRQTEDGQHVMTLRYALDASEAS
jgi:hypothetical protein